MPKPDIHSASSFRHKTAKDNAQSPSAESGALSVPGGLSIRRSPLAPGLYLIATPIGNLRDITLRALDTLASADIVLAEDTRQSRKLLDAYQIKTSLSPYHDHNAAKRVPALIKKLEDGASIALISDAGTPLVSDPGYKLARAAIDAGQNVFAVPGASAVLCGLSVSGLASDKFMFAGFLPPKTGARKTALGALMAVPSSLIFFETAPRLSAVLADMLDIFGDRQAVIARELTKKYEEVLRGTLSELIAQLEGPRLRGEIVLMLAPPAGGAIWDDEAVDKALRARLSDLGVKRASEEIASLSGLPKRQVYARALQIKDE